jgi:hypothetical protein
MKAIFIFFLGVLAEEFNEQLKIWQLENSKNLLDFQFEFQINEQY